MQVNKPAREAFQMLRESAGPTRHIRHHISIDVAGREPLACSRMLRSHVRVPCCTCDEMLWRH